MLRLKNLSNKYQKRLIRPEYAHTQATPYGAKLASTFRATDGSLQLPKSGDTTPLATRTADAYTLKNSLVPGTVMVRALGENVGVATGVNVAEQPFGLLANFIGGDFDEGFAGDSLQNEVGVWRGPDAVFTLLAPAWNDTGVSAAFAGAGTGVPITLIATADGRLGYNGTPGNRVAVCRLIDRPSASRILIDLLI